MDETRRQLMTIAVVSALVAGGFFAYEHFAADPPAPSERVPLEGEPAEADAAPTPDDEEAAARRAQARTLRLETDHYEATVTSLNTALTSFRLKGERFLEGGQPVQMVTTDLPEYLPFAVDLRGVNIPPDALWEVVDTSPTSVRFTWEGKGFRVVRTLEAGEGYALWSTLEVTNTSRGARPVRPVFTTHHYVSADDEGGGGFLSFRPSPRTSQGVCHHDGDTVRKGSDDLVTEPHGYGPGVRWAGIESVYFATLLAPHEEPARHCALEAFPRGGTFDEPQGTLFESQLAYDRHELAPGETRTWRTLAYIGPKEHDWLAAAGHELTEAVDLGWFSWIAQWLVALLRWIYGLVGNWGLAIILLTVLVKLVLYPLTEKSFQSMARMRQLKPEMDRINALYAEDREKKGMAIMELYRKHKINPLGGCLPTLLQLPVWFALYQSLLTNVELYHAPFALWWTDLSAPDPYFVLPLTLGLLMFGQQKLTPTTMDATQAKIMMYMMPVMITVFMLFLPSGLTLYMVTNSTLGIAQQRWIQYRLDRQGPLTAAEDDDAASGDGSTGDGTPNDPEPTEAKLKPKTAKTSPSRAKARGNKRRQRRGRA
jgi:YidC/Oxa1 family membrane protein insertase